MPVVHELFGYPLDDKSPAAKRSRRNALCPFMGTRCDGGGNRDMAQVNLRESAALRAHFDKVGDRVDCGICSVMQNKREWVICPRRILCFSESEHQAAALNRTLSLSGWKPPQRLAVWREIRVRVAKGKHKFNYAFDYIIRRLGRDGAPTGGPLVVEIMTCSTSGGKVKEGTDIKTAFCKAVMGEQHRSPGVNHRQVWARMASQLIVKSEAGIQWGGRTIWVIQDALADYIDESTGLRLAKMRAKRPGEVNLLAFRYDDKKSAPRQLADADFFAGPIAANGDGKPCFLDIIRAPFVPDFGKLESALEKKEFQVLEWDGKGR